VPLSTTIAHLALAAVGRSSRSTPTQFSRVKGDPGSYDPATRGARDYKDHIGTLSIRLRSIACAAAQCYRRLFPSIDHRSWLPALRRSPGDRSGDSPAAEHGCRFWRAQLLIAQLALYQERAEPVKVDRSPIERFCEQRLSHPETAIRPGASFAASDGLRDPGGTTWGQGAALYR
jgi:hypothetical protein